MVLGASYALFVSEQYLFFPPSVTLALDSHCATQVLPTSFPYSPPFPFPFLIVPLADPQFNEVSIYFEAVDLATLPIYEPHCQFSLIHTRWD